MSLSTVVVPVLLDTNTESAHLLRQWVRLYHYGHILMPAVCVATCGLYGYAALSKRALLRREWLLYAVAGVTTISMVPFTWAMMAPTNNILFGMEASTTASVADLGAVQELVVRWAWLHAVRSLFPLAGVIVGLTSVLIELGV